LLYNDVRKTKSAAATRRKGDHMKQFERIIDYLYCAALNNHLNLFLLPVQIVHENGKLLAEYPNALAVKHCHHTLTISSFEITPDNVLVFHLNF